ncbi:hypothetical protein SAMN05660971_02909 [Halomonas cupida]|uniref:Uncharacterized protein n=1 Tax=Halomonas cupida TaxID=44933 RepID=A0A1M7IM93_9GAMM|nr:hypothetical protein SAMN05660971_02909 [Halomonas cupida]
MNPGTAAWGIPVDLSQPSNVLAIKPEAGARSPQLNFTNFLRLRTQSHIEFLRGAAVAFAYTINFRLLNLESTPCNSFC